MLTLITKQNTLAVNTVFRNTHTNIGHIDTYLGWCQDSMMELLSFNYFNKKSFIVDVGDVGNGPKTTLLQISFQSVAPTNKKRDKVLESMRLISSRT